MRALEVLRDAVELEPSMTEAGDRGLRGSTSR
jgi:hypothetical protein